MLSGWDFELETLRSPAWSIASLGLGLSLLLGIIYSFLMLLDIWLGQGRVHDALARAIPFAGDSAWVLFAIGLVASVAAAWSFALVATLLRHLLSLVREAMIPAGRRTAGPWRNPLNPSRWRRLG